MRIRSGRTLGLSPDGSSPAGLSPKPGGMSTGGYPTLGTQFSGRGTQLSGLVLLSLRRLEVLEYVLDLFGIAVYLSFSLSSADLGLGLGFVESSMLAAAAAGAAGVAVAVEAGALRGGFVSSRFMRAIVGVR